MKKRGFTLVELLAVIAILAILVIMALPAVLRMFNNARRDSFTNEVNTVIRTARQQYLLSGGADTEWSNAEGSTKSLDLTGNSQLRYYVKMNAEGKIIKLQVSNGDFQYSKSGIIDVAESSDVVEVTSENELIITIDNNGGSATSVVYYDSAGAIQSSPETAAQSTASVYGMSTFSKVTYEEIQAWCIHGSNGSNTCDDIDPNYFDTEAVCLSGLTDMPNNGTTYTCQYETVNMPSDIQVGFIVDNTDYYLKYDAQYYDENKATMVSAFGRRECYGDIAMSNKNTLMNILGIMDVNAAASPTIDATCSNSTLKIVAYFDGRFAISSLNGANTLHRCNYYPNIIPTCS